MTMSGIAYEYASVLYWWSSDAMLQERRGDDIQATESGYEHIRHACG